MKDQPVSVSGGCLCGKIRYEADVLLKSGYICHCRICQKSTGAPAEITVPIKSGTLRFITEEPNYYVTSDYGRRGFCSECGSRIVWQAIDPENDWLTNLTVGTLDDPSAAEPACHIFIDTQIPWYHLNESLPTYREEEADALLEKWQKERNSE